MRTTTYVTTVLAAGAVALTGCGDAATATPEPITVGAFDYAFEGVPATVAAGTTFELDNESDNDEVHELLAVKLADGEERSASDLLALAPPELGTLIDEGLAGFAAAFPASFDGEPPVGSEVTVAEPGRYLLLCLLPTGGPPDEIAASLAEYVARDGVGGPPAHPETGPPHAVQGMVTEVTVS